MSVRGDVTYEAAGMIRSCRPSFALIDELETIAGGGLQRIMDMLEDPDRSFATVGRCMIAVMKHSTPPLEEPESHEAVCTPGVSSWVVSPDRPNRWGVLPEIAFLALYGPENLREALAESARPDADSEDDGKKKTT